ncbi:MAG: hypothetical protein AAGF75_04420 [Cyanobacteria bacterium P01_H01_bin.130]
MAKGKSSQFVCSECGNIEVSWFGKCPACGTFGSLVEEAIAKPVAPSQIKTSAALDSSVQGSPSSTTPASAPRGWHCCWPRW